MQLDAHAVAKAAPRDLARHVLELVARQRDAGRVDAVALGGPEQQPAPTAADVEETLARRQPELPADMVELLRLRGVQRVVVAAEVRARVHHALVEPQPVERVADVVVVLDVLAVRAPLAAASA